MGGSEACRSLWSTIYKNVKISAIVLVVDYAEIESYFIQSRQMLHFLVNEDELRYCSLIVVINRKSDDQGLNVKKEEIEKIKQNVKTMLDIEDLPPTVDFKDNHVFYESAKNKEAAQLIFKKTAAKLNVAS